MNSVPRHHRADVLVVGGGLGGVAAALAALRRGSTVVLTEETDWLGGQLTAQATPPDEHPWIEQFGCTRSYRMLREGIRDHYRRWYPLTAESRNDPYLNPGRGRVSKLCHEPRVAERVIEDLLSPYIASGRLTVLLRTHPIAAEHSGGTVSTVHFQDDEGRQVAVSGRYVLDASELGDLLPLADVDYVTGFESRSETGEPSAPATAQPANMQAFSWVFAMSYDGDGDHTIERPLHYDHWRTKTTDFWPGPMIGLNAPDPRTLQPMHRTFTPNVATENHFADQSKDPGDRELWEFRRILSRDVFEPGFLTADVVLANWPMIDYIDGNIIDVSPEEKARHLAASREMSASMLYWLQTEAPRPDGGVGWPGLYPRGDVLGTNDGFAKAPYIRESRRIRGLRTVVEQDISMELRGDAGAAEYPDTVGIGMYRIDLHPSSGGDNYIDVASCPFQIPLGALVPASGGNVLAAGKTAATTHITNGSFRLHPVEWNIGEAAGALAAHCVAEGIEPATVFCDERRLADFQQQLVADGFELQWPRVEGY
ncbi:FAD-dependent oxidoreductase [Rathayibacter sp. CAU 1779]